MSGFRNVFRGSQQKFTKSEADKLVLDQLGTVGTDLKKPREVIHYLYMPNQRQPSKQPKHFVRKTIR